MGVKDLGPIILKHASSAVTPAPSLAYFANRTVAIDANLLTTKFHHTSSSSAKYEQHRHVRSWYWFLQALERESIRPVVVFDGSTRLPEKEKENLRRRAAREQQRVRGAAEQDRGERLRELKEVWGGVAKEDRQAVAGAFRQFVAADTPAEVSVDVDDRLRRPLEELGALHSAFRNDEANPVYSRNQVLITAEERAFFDFIVLQETSMDADLIDDGEELAQVIARSDALGLSHRKRSAGVPKSAFVDSMRLVQALGIPLIQPAPDQPHEAEGLCSTLYSLGLVDYVISEDTDVAVYGAPLIRRVTTSPAVPSVVATQRVARRSVGKEKEGMTVLDPVKLREELGLTNEQFVDFALLCGTDFTERIPLLGPAKALTFIREYHTIESVLTSQSRYQPADPDAYLGTIRAARAIFLQLPPLPPNLDLTPQAPDLNLRSLLKEWGIEPRRTAKPTVEASAETLDVAAEVDNALDEVLDIEAERLEEFYI